MNGCANQASKVEGKVLSHRRLTILSVAFLIVGSILAGITFQRNPHKTTVAFQNEIAVKTENPAFKTPRSLAELLDLSPPELEHCDIAQMNLLCAESLPGAENLNVDEMLVTLDAWAQHIKSEIDRNFHHYGEDPAYFYNSTNFYKMAMMGVVLYEDYSIRYNPKWIAPPGAESPDDHFFADSRDVLIHGLIGDQHLGTCSSMPILYIALGRRLGYPLKLVKAKGHLFVRWDSPAEKFDMEATSKGVHYYDDEEYRKWPFPLSETDIQEEDYLKSLSAKEELSVFQVLQAANVVPQVRSPVSLSPSRWIQRDTIAKPGSDRVYAKQGQQVRPDQANLYGFVNNDPQNEFDPFGLESSKPPKPDDVPECYTSQPLPPSDPVCDRYGERTYLGASLKCFCKTPWLDDPWSRYVRACLACMDAKGVPIGDAHSACYSVADKTYPRPTASLGLAWCSCRK